MKETIKRLDQIISLLIKISNMSVQLKNFYLSNEAAKYIGCSESHLDKLAARGKIAYLKPGGKKRVFTKQDLDQYLLQNPIKPDSDIAREANNRID